MIVGKYTQEKAEMVVRWIKNLEKTEGVIHCQKNCVSHEEHAHLCGYNYESAVFMIHLNAKTPEHDARKFLAQLEGHDKIFHCRRSGLIFVHDDVKFDAVLKLLESDLGPFEPELRVKSA